MENIRLETFKESIKDGKIQKGAGVTLSETTITEILGELGFDFLWIDREHSFLSDEEVYRHIQICGLSHMLSFVRVRDHDPATVKPILEMKPDGVIFPMVNTAQEARDLVSACTYPTRGIRGFGPRRAHNFGLINGEEYMNYVDKCFWRIMQIEHIEAVKNLDEILKVEGIDSIVVGPNDLSISMGLFGQYDHHEVVKVMDEIAEKCIDHKIPFGVSVYDEKNILTWKNRGANWIEVGADWGYLLDGAKVCKERLDKVCGGQQI